MNRGLQPSAHFTQRVATLSSMIQPKVGSLRNKQLARQIHGTSKVLTTKFDKNTPNSYGAIPDTKMNLTSIICTVRPFRAPPLNCEDAESGSTCSTLVPKLSLNCFKSQPETVPWLICHWNLHGLLLLVTDFNK